MAVAIKKAVLDFGLIKKMIYVGAIPLWLPCFE